jgi:hypothetical protein
MNSSSPFVPPGITADLPPPFLPTSPLGVIVFLLICAAAFFCLRRLFRRRAKDSGLKIQGVDGRKQLPAPGSNDRPPMDGNQEIRERKDPQGVKQNKGAE